PYGFVDPDGNSAITKAVKLIINGGDFADTFSDVIQAAAVVADPSASIGIRALAALEIASEFAPVSIGDAKDAAKLFNRVEDVAKGVSEATKKAPVVIGEDMKNRVIPTAPKKSAVMSTSRGASGQRRSKNAGQEI
ncbi:MAG: hypothetical protein ACREV1_16135, partial [Gammaproteobacteria bacterium]